MADPLVARLRRLAEIEEPHLRSEVVEAWSLLGEAADEIDRLRGFVSDWINNAGSLQASFGRYRFRKEAHEILGEES